MPAAKAVNFIAADFDVEIAHRNEARKRSNFVLRGEYDASGSHRVHEAELFNFRKTPGQFEFSPAVDARVGNGLVEGNFGRPLRNGVVAFAAFVKADLDAKDFVQHVGSALDQKISEAWSGPCVDYG